MAVSDWPAYLLRNIPHDLRETLSEQAEADDVSLADVIRQALCQRYDMECEPASYGYQPTLDSGADIILIRLQPEVFKLIRKETRGRYGETRRLILETLTDYLEETTQ